MGVKPTADAQDPTAASAAVADAALPPGYRRRLASLHARALLGLVASGALVALAAGAALLAARRFWPWYLALEGAFLFVWLLRKRVLDRVPDEHYEFPKGHDTLKTFDHFRRSMGIIARDSRSYDMVGRWFDYAPINQIKRQNVRDLLAYGFGYRRAAEFDAAGEGDVPDTILGHIESKWGNDYAEGFNPDIKYMSHLHEPLRACPKPLWWYLFAEGLGAIKHAVLAAAGFRCERRGGFLYYTLGLPPASDAAASAAAAAAAGGYDAAPPLVFCHGVGLGLLPYIHFVLKAAALGRPLVAIEWPHLALRWTSFIPTVDQCAEVLLGILDVHAIPKAAFVGHSFGTFFMARLQRTAPHRVAAMAFVDPVCMCMWSGHLIRSFVLRPHATKSGPITWNVSRDIHTAAAVARRFYWSEYNLWPDMFPEKCLVVLSGRDDLVPVMHVESMVRDETGAAMMIHRQGKHAAFLFDLKWQVEVLAGVWRLVDGCGAGGAAAEGGQVDATAAAERAASRSPSGELPAAATEQKSQPQPPLTRAARRLLAHGHSDSAFSLSYSASLGSLDGLARAGSGGGADLPDAPGSAPDACAAKGPLRRRRGSGGGAWAADAAAALAAKGAGGRARTRQGSMSAADDLLSK